MASFLDKAGLTKFWKNVKLYIDEWFNTINSGIIEFNTKLNDTANLVYNNTRVIKIPNNAITFSYNEDIKGYSANNGNLFPHTGVLLKFYKKLLLLKYIEDRYTDINLTSILYETIPEDNSEKYLGRLPEHEVYEELSDKIYSSKSFDIYLRKIYTGTTDSPYEYYLILIPVPISNCYTFNFITGEQMIRYLGGNNKPMSSYNFYKVNLLINSPFDFTNTLGYGEDGKFDIGRMVNLSNEHDIEYTIRYPRYLNGLLTFLKYNYISGRFELADKTPNVVDGTYNEVVLTKDTGLYMYGDISISSYDFPITEQIKFDISTTQDITYSNKLLSLKGDISTIYGLLNTFYSYNRISSGTEVDLLTDRDNFKLFHSPCIGNIDMSKLPLYIPSDPLNKHPLYKKLFNNTGISTATVGIHFIGNHPYITCNQVLQGIFNNFEGAYQNCNKLTKLIVYIYLEGDLNLDSTLEDYHIDNYFQSIAEMINGSFNVNTVVFLPGVIEGLETDDFEKFSKLIKSIVDRIKVEDPSIKIEIKAKLGI